MAYDAGAAFEAVYALVAALPGVAATYRGVPETLGPRVSAYVTLGGMTVVRREMGRIDRRELRIRVYLAYRVAGAEATAETTMCGLADALVLAVSRDPTIGGAVQSSTFDAALADAPEYAVLAGSEYRVWPATVTTTQDQTLAPGGA